MLYCRRIKLQDILDRCTSIPDSVAERMHRMCPKEFMHSLTVNVTPPENGGPHQPPIAAEVEIIDLAADVALDVAGRINQLADIPGPLLTSIFLVINSIEEEWRQGAEAEILEHFEREKADV